MPDSSRRVVGKDTATQVLDMMHDVVATGTGKRARIDGYSVAGKSGTAERR